MDYLKEFEDLSDLTKDIFSLSSNWVFYIRIVPRGNKVTTPEDYNRAKEIIRTFLIEKNVPSKEITDFGSPMTNPVRHRTKVLLVTIEGQWDAGDIAGLLPKAHDYQNGEVMISLHQWAYSADGSPYSKTINQPRSSEIAITADGRIWDWRD